MKKFIYMAVAAIAALSSCSSDNDPIMGETGKQALTFTATMEGSATSRATYNSTEKRASWEEGDQISINGKTYNAQSAGLTTTFKAATEGQEAEGPTFNAYFACTYDGETATLPAAVSETWADGKFNMPMYATSTTTDLAFKNLCGVLKITVKSNQIAAVKKIKVSSASKAVSGAFTVTSDAAVLSDPNTIANTLTVTYTDAVSTTAEGKVFYVAVPAQTYQKLKIELDADGNGFTKSMTTKSATDITVERNKIYPITYADNAANPHLLSGSFSVASDKTVKFTKSNLYWSSTDSKFHFEAQPTDYPTTRETTHVGHFFWATTAEKSYAASYDGTGATTSDTFFADGNDGRTLTADGISGLYFLSADEWTYLLKNRINASRLMKYGVKVKVEEGTYAENCLIIAPDDPSATSGNVISTETSPTLDLATLESKGYVILPAAGFSAGSSVYEPGQDGNYWSSTPRAEYASMAHYLYFDSGRADVVRNPRGWGFSLRAVLAE